MKFRERFPIALEHFDAAVAAQRQWNCECDHCDLLREWQAQREAAQMKKREHVHLLCEIVCLRERLAESYSHKGIVEGDQRRLAEAQIKFERIMIRKLKLDDLSGATWYGFKPKVKKAVAA